MLQVLVELCTKHQEDVIVNTVVVHNIPHIVNSESQNPNVHHHHHKSHAQNTHIWSNISLVCLTSVSSSCRFFHRFSYTLCDSAVHATCYSLTWSPNKIWWTVQILKSISLWFYPFKYSLCPFSLNTFLWRIRSLFEL